MNNLTVTELNNIIEKNINSNFRNKILTIVGEISNLKYSGRHTYLTLKDDNTSLSVVFWGTKLDNKHGDNVEIMGKLEYYKKSSNINFIGKNITNIGIGSLHIKYEKLKDKYEKKGYFNNKKPLPKSIKNVGIITSEDGAALRDFLYVLENKEFSGTVYVYNCSVQGNNCPSTVASGIKFFNSIFYARANSDTNTSSNTDNNSDSSEDPFMIVNKNITDINKRRYKKRKKIDYENRDIEVEVDIVVITRGGGSFEDLMGFSDKKVIEAIYNSNKYIISAVGHEVDTMLSDMVANYRAPTPSIAGEIIVSINTNNKQKIEKLEDELKTIKHEMLKNLYKYKNDILKIQNSVLDPTQEFIEHIDKLYYETKEHIKNKLDFYRKRLREIRDIINSDNPEYILKQGFIVLTDNNGEILHDIKNIFNNKVTLIHSTGTYNIKIKSIKN